MLQNQPKQSKTTTSAGSYGRYLGIAYKMIAFILVCCFIGIKLDGYLHTSPAFIVIMLLVGVVGAMYVVIKNA